MGQANSAGLSFKINVASWTSSGSNCTYTAPTTTTTTVRCCCRGSTQSKCFEIEDQVGCEWVESEDPNDCVLTSTSTTEESGYCYSKRWMDSCTTLVPR